jgi:CheY-like chemotaxis protein
VTDSSSRRIVLAENNPELAWLLQTVLGQQPGWQCPTVVGSGAALLQAAQAAPADAYLVDLSLDDGSVLPWLARLRQLQRDALVIAFTGSATAELEAQCRDAGCAALLRKDGDVGALLQALRGHLG